MDSTCDKIRHILLGLDDKKVLDVIDMYRRHYITGLLQRHDFMCSLSSNLRSFKYVYFVDVVGLHNVNRKQGYKAGDDILKRTSDILLKTFPNGDVFHTGGDEFFVINDDKINMDEYGDLFTYSCVNICYYDNTESVLKDLDDTMILKKSNLYRRKNDKKDDYGI